MPYRFIEASQVAQGKKSKDSRLCKGQMILSFSKFNVKSGNPSAEEEDMHKTVISVAASALILISGSMAKAQVDLSAYADPEGFLDVQTLTCAQLAGTWQGQADLLTAWYSGWYNGLAKKHYMDIRKGREAEHEVIVYCKANPEIKVIQAMDVIFKSMRER
jgi:hypothetical protein